MGFQRSRFVGIVSVVLLFPEPECLTDAECPEQSSSERRRVQFVSGAARTQGVVLGVSSTEDKPVGSPIIPCTPQQIERLGEMAPELRIILSTSCS